MYYLYMIYDICLCALMFTKKCLISDSDVRYVATYGVQYGRMSSTHGSNVDFCCERFSQSQRDILGDVFNKRHAYYVPKQEGH